MKTDHSCFSCSSSQELLQIKERVTQSYKEAETILTSIPDGIILLSHLGSILIFNSQARTILNLPEELEVLHQPFSDIFPDSFFGFSIKQVLNSAPQPKTIRLTLTVNDLERDVEIFVKKNISNGHIFILIRDRSDYKQLETSIEKYKNIAELGKITATLAHEIRNPLSGISGFAALLKEEIQNPRHQRMLTSIIQGTLSLNNLISSMLEYTKVPTLNLKITDLQNFFSSLIPTLSMTFPSCRFERHTDLSFFCSIDSDRLSNVIWNLVKNASEATQDSVTVTLHESGALSVKNPGYISQHVINQLFTPFFTTKTQGHGLGLAEAKKTMRLHDGDIVVNNQDHHVVFTLTLPKINQ